MIEKRPAPFARWMIALTALPLVVMTLRPSAGNATFISPTCVLCGERGSADLVLNILLFVPFGAALARLGWRPLLVAGVGLVLSACIEVAQTVIPGRSPTFRDVLMNAFGAGLGAVMLRAAWTGSRSRFGRTLAWASAILAIAVISFSGWLMQPSVRRNGWYGHLSPRLGHLAPWQGRVDSVRVGGEGARHGYLLNAASVQEAIRRRSLISIHGVAGPSTSRLAGIFVVSDDDFEEMLLIGQQGQDLIMRERRRASTLRLFEPELRLKGFFTALPPGTPFALEIVFGRTDACASVGTERRCAAPLPASIAWSLLLWRRFWNDRVRVLFGGATFVLLFVPAGFFGAALSWQARALLAGVALLGTWAAVATTGLAPPTLLEWTAIIAGLAAGLAGGALGGTRIREREATGTVP